MSLSVEERQRLNDILEENRRTADPISPVMSEDHPLVEQVREVVLGYREEGKAVFMAKHIAPHVDWENQAIGGALHALRNEGLVEPADDGKQTPYRWVIVEEPCQ